jgi:hypothetical protein
MPLHPEEVLVTKDRLVRPSPCVTSFFLPHNSLGVGERGFNQMITQLHQLTGPIYQLVIGTFNALLTGINSLVLNWHRRRIQPWSCRLFTYYSLTFPTSGLHFLPMDPVRSQVKQSNITKRSREGTNTKSREWEPPLDFYHKLPSKHSVC